MVWELRLEEEGAVKISMEFRIAASNPSPGLFFGCVSVAAGTFAMKYIDHDATAATLEQKTNAYLLLAAIAESEGL